MFKKIIITWLVFFGFILPTPIYASYLYFSPSEIKTDIDSDFDVQIRLNTLNDSVNAATISINYPADLLSVNGLNFDKSALEIPVESNSGDGAIKITRGSFNNINGDVNIGTITFHSQKSGSSQLSISSTSKVPRLYDFADSLESTKNGIETISINSTSKMSNSSANTDNSCKTKENLIKANSKKILDSGEDILNSIDHISQAVQNQSKNSVPPQLNSDYQFKTANIQLQKSSSQQNLNTAQNDINSYGCDKSDAKLKLNQFKKDIGNLKQSLKNYRQSVKDLIGILNK